MRGKRAESIREGATRRAHRQTERLATPSRLSHTFANDSARTPSSVSPANASGFELAGEIGRKVLAEVEKELHK